MSKTEWNYYKELIKEIHKNLNQKNEAKRTKQEGQRKRKIQA